ncbi:MAG: electron transfer flavoprotein subunit alpha/FixB family protein [Elusimicrobia bacterium]|nr:electron transfer flavoprotein subunit alpha/FixB family protein [Candidatus Obscuribacterium magneticum]
MSNENAILAVPVDTENHRDVWTYAEVRHGKLIPSAYELLFIGKKLAADLNQKVAAVIIGKNVSSYAQKLIDHGADKVYMIEHDALEQFVDETYAQVLTDLVIKEKPNKLLMAASTIGRSFASRIAVLTNTGLTADATEVDINKDNGLLNATRPTFGGTLMATILCKRHRPEMVTVRPMVFPRATPQPGRTGEIIKVPVDPSQWKQRERHLRFEPETNQEIDISQANIIVSGGYGVKDTEGFNLLKELAHALGGAVGASRRAVDSGWIPYRHQIGLTGRVVRPKLYIACGISGQIQHLAGMNSADTIVCINKDPEAPLMKLATIAIEGDLFEILPAVKKELETRGLTKKMPVGAVADN